MKDVAELKGCSIRYIQSLAQQGSLQYEASQGANGRSQYLIPLSALDFSLQRKWYQRQRLPVPKELKPKKSGRASGSGGSSKLGESSKASGPGSADKIGGLGEASGSEQQSSQLKSLEAFTAAQRQEIGQWIGILQEWQQFRGKYASKAEADTAFVANYSKLHPDHPPLSQSILYRKWAAFRADDLDSLIDRRGLWKKGSSSIDDQVWRVFLTYYLDQGNYPISECVKYTQFYLQQKQLDLPLPHESSFRRRVAQDIPKAVISLERQGEKTLHDRYLPYIHRLYDTMQSNDYWVADNHTFDFMTLGENGRPHRLYLTAYIDARSTAFMGWKVTTAPCGEATIAALRDAIETRKRGLPDFLYVDNGSEFLVHDIGGRGHRTRKSQKQQPFEPPPILTRLGITMLNAIPGNPEAKIIERIFLDVKNQFSRLVESFCGGSIIERPERLNNLVKSGKLPTDEELINGISNFIEGYYNHLPYNGAVKKDCGKAKIQVYEENLLEIRRPATPDDLNLLLMRSSRPVKVGRRGVHLDIAGFPMDYWTDAFLQDWQDKKVYFRYDPADLNSVRVYTPEDQFICALPVDNEAVQQYGAAGEDIKAGMRKVNRYRKQIKEWANGRTLDKQERISAYVLVQLEAQRNLENPPDYDTDRPKVVRLVQASEQLYEPLQMAVGELTSLDTMIHNARKFHEEDDS